MRTYLYAILALALVFMGNNMGIVYGFYSNATGYDIFMHLAGGIGIGLFAAAVLELHAAKKLRSRGMIVLAVLVAGILWELFEAYYNIAGAPVGTKAYWIDTVKDLIDDVLGGWIIATIRWKMW